MHKKWRLLSTLLTLSAAPLLASSSPAVGEWEISGDYLYLMPTMDDTYFVINAAGTSTAPTGRRENNNFDFHSGFRAGLGYGLSCDQALSFSYTWLGATQNKTVAGSFLWATQGRSDFAAAFENYSGTASSSLSSLYENLEAMFVQKTLKCRDLSLNLQAGLEGAYLRLNETYNYVITGGATGNVYQQCKTWGFGPQFGFGLDYDIAHFGCSCPGALSFFAGGSASLLTGTTHNSTNNVLASASILSTTDEIAWRVFPALHARLGFGYDVQLCGFDTSFQIGYEFDSYLRSLTRVDFPDDVADGRSYNNYYNYDVQGLFVSAAIRF